MSEGVRGRPASSQTVDLYRLLHEADHPMTLDEIAAEVGGMPSAYRTAANIAYREHLVLQGVIVRRYVVSAGNGLIAGRGDRTDPRLAPAVGRGHLVGPRRCRPAVRRLPNQ